MLVKKSDLCQHLETECECRPKTCGFCKNQISLNKLKVSVTALLFIWPEIYNIQYINIHLTTIFFAWTVKYITVGKFYVQAIMHGSIWPVTPPPPHPLRAAPETSPALRSQGWGIVWSRPVLVVGGGANQKYLFFDFAKYMSFLARFARWLRTSILRIFKGKLRNLWLKRNNLSILSLYLMVCFTNVRMMRTRMHFFMEENERNTSSA